jgi:hypothetical protein
MSVEHRRQLLAFFIVALAAVLLIGNGLNDSALRDAIRGGSSDQAAIATGVTLVPGQAGIELGGSARGTTVIESDSASGTAAAHLATSRGKSPVRVAPGRSAQAPSARGSVQTSKSSAQKHVGKRSTLRSARTSDARLVDDGTTAHGTTAHGKKAHGKKAHGKKAHAGKHGSKSRADR